MPTPCSKCGVSHDRYGQSYCKACHAEYMRARRPSYAKLTDEQRRKVNCRSYTNELLKRGQITREACTQCGSADSQAHHPDYSNPRLVEWLCRSCHLELHRVAS